MSERMTNSVLVQMHFLQAGVLWHLILTLFEYDCTLEESGVEETVPGGAANTARSWWSARSTLSPHLLNIYPGKWTISVN